MTLSRKQHKELARLRNKGPRKWTLADRKRKLTLQRKATPFNAMPKESKS